LHYSVLDRAHAYPNTNVTLMSVSQNAFILDLRYTPSSVPSFDQPNCELNRKGSRAKGGNANRTWITNHRGEYCLSTREREREREGERERERSKIGVSSCNSSRASLGYALFGALMINMGHDRHDDLCGVRFLMPRPLSISRND